MDHPSTRTAPMTTNRGGRPGIPGDLAVGGAWQREFRGRGVGQAADGGRPVRASAVAALLDSDTDLSLTALVRVPAVDLQSYDGLLPVLSSVTNQAAATSRGNGGNFFTPATQGPEEAKDGSGTSATEGSVGGVLARTAPGGDAARVRGAICKSADACAFPCY